MTSSPAVTSLYSHPDTLSSMSVHRQSPSTYDWSPSQRGLNQDSLDGSEGLEALSHASPKDTTSSRRSSAQFQKLSYSPTPLILPHVNASEAAKSNPKSAAPKDPFVREEGLGAAMGTNLRRLANRWSYNGSEKLLSPSTFQDWNLAEELSNLQLESAKDRTTTPPKISSTGILRIQESSPLDTSSSDASLDSISQPDESRLTLPSHSRGSSTDTSSSEHSIVSHKLGLNMKANNVAAEVAKDRPRSFSGAIFSDMELRRLQQAGSRDLSVEDIQENRHSPVTRDIGSSGNLSRSSSSSFDQSSNSGQPMFPSLSVHPMQSQGQPPARSFGSNVSDNSTRNVDPRGDLAAAHARQSAASGQRNTSYGQASGRQAHNQVDVATYRQQPPPPLNLFQQHVQLQSQGTPLIPSPTNFGYAPHPNNAALTNSHLPLNNPQQLYEMMLPVMDANIARAQHLYRGVHQHSASDPAPMRDAAAALLLSNSLHGMQNGSFATPIPALYPLGLPTPPIYAAQFFPQPSPNLQDAYNQEMLNAAMGRLLPQYPQNSVPAAGVQPHGADVDPNGEQTGPSTNNRKLGLYKTELCRSWEEKGTCRYGPKCQFAHGEDEIQRVSRHPKYKTEICRTFWVSGSCPYGKRCCFIHTELPAAGAPPGTEGNSPPPTTDGRARSTSTNSDPNEGTQVSMLARISAKRNQEASAGTPTTPMDSSTPSQATFSHSKPASLRVDTNVLDNAASKQNKSAFPSFATNAVSAMSPGPVTAAPDFGRHGSTMRLNVMDVNQRLSSATSPTATRQNLNGMTSRPGSSTFEMSSTDSSSNVATPVHSRSGSASNWAQLTNKAQFASPASFSHTSSSPGGDLHLNGNAAAMTWARQN